MNSIGDIIDGFIEEKTEQLATQELELVIDVFRQDFDKMTKLVNLFKRNKGRKGFEKSAYQSIAELLFQNGVKKLDGTILSVSQVNRYLGIVRKERNKLAVGSVQSNKKNSRKVLGQITPDYSWVYAKKSTVAPVKIENGNAELARLRSEEKKEIDGWNVWTGKDESIWRHILNKIDEWNKDKEPAEHWRYEKNFHSFTDKAMIEVYELLMKKLKKPIRPVE
ncbi:hypothetical protein [Burkholderia gladioli]|uniref:hypothetical protein n=1 Tax=Burkholderia gladioli TaxID=28095 RepID=UPI001C5D28A0|nr:hypothetical protein [Burkholderia gladioli]MBW5287154.1 hypothetical protein [Burkholderia gladioli]